MKNAVLNELHFFVGTQSVINTLLKYWRPARIVNSFKEGPAPARYQAGPAFVQGRRAARLRA
jgi:hypothetical protein